MELKIENGRYVPEAQGTLAHVSGAEELRQRVLMKLTARRGGFAAMPDFGSRLHLLGRVRPSERAAAAAQYVSEALADEKGLRLANLELTETESGSARLALRLDLEGEDIYVETEV